MPTPIDNAIAAVATAVLLCNAKGETTWADGRPRPDPDRPAPRDGAGFGGGAAHARANQHAALRKAIGDLIAVVSAGSRAPNAVADTGGA